MIADSPYRQDELVLSPAGGAAAGIAASIAMLALLFGLRPLSGLSVPDALERLGGVLTGGAGTRAERVLVGAMLHLLAGAVFGLLYAVSQRRLPGPTLIGVGVFYGLAIWVASRIIGRIFLALPLRQMVRSRAWFLACLLYGLCLSIWALWSENHRAALPAPALPKD
jgi:hypothetical protein